ncbi:hypothetical protein [Kitasatospora sp. NPDC094011]|uniref:hypothetical protein n=1 Tax=Kitasatospora sp. NPDC094011 TaxID=3364090 RepID=UPI003810AE22
MTTGRHISRNRTTTLADPALPPEVRATVHRIGRQHPHLLRDPDAPLPRAAALDTTQLARRTLIVALALVVLAPVVFWLQSPAARKLGAPALSAPSSWLVIGAVSFLSLLMSLATTWTTARTPGGRPSVARHLAAARGRYLLHGDDLSPEAWDLTVKAHHAVEHAFASTQPPSAVDRPDRVALRSGIWAMARGMAGGAGTAAAQDFVTAVEVYGACIDEANEIGLALSDAGEHALRLARAVARANRAGTHALALATATAG